MAHFRAEVYPNTTKKFTLDFHEDSGKDAVQHIRDVAEDDGVYFALTKKNEVGEFVNA